MQFRWAAAIGLRWLEPRHLVLVRGFESRWLAVHPSCIEVVFQRVLPKVDNPFLPKGRVEHDSRPIFGLAALFETQRGKKNVSNCSQLQRILSCFVRLHRERL